MLSRGALDFVKRDHEAILIHGWVLSFDGGTATSFVVSAGDEPVDVVDLTTRQASPDIEAAFPSIRGSDCARFTIRCAVPRSDVPLIRIVPQFGGDGGSALFGLPADAIPRPDKEAVDVIGGDFFQAFEFLSHFIEHGGLEASMDVLDVGCGVGRMAVPLAFFLLPSARYEGFDVAESGVAWATNVISRQFPNFKFRHVDVCNDAYNPSGRLQSVDFAFPYDDERFDFVYLTSVLTHMRGPEVRHYLSEIRRVLRPDGRCLCTCFLLDDEARQLLATGKGTERLIHLVGDGFTSDPELPEKAIGFDSRSFNEWLAAARLDAGLCLLGGWCGRERYASYQDILVLERTGA